MPKRSWRIEQKKKTGDTITVPKGLSREELLAWIKALVATGKEQKKHSRFALRNNRKRPIEEISALVMLGEEKTYLL